MKMMKAGKTTRMNDRQIDIEFMSVMPDVMNIPHEISLTAIDKTERREYYAAQSDSVDA